MVDYAVGFAGLEQALCFRQSAKDRVLALVGCQRDVVLLQLISHLEHVAGAVVGDADGFGQTLIHAFREALGDR